MFVVDALAAIFSGDVVKRSVVGDGDDLVGEDVGPDLLGPLVALGQAVVILNDPAAERAGFEPHLLARVAERARLVGVDDKREDRIGLLPRVGRGAADQVFRRGRRLSDGRASGFLRRPFLLGLGHLAADQRRWRSGWVSWSGPPRG